MTTNRNPFAGIKGIKNKRVVLAKLSAQAKYTQRQLKAKGNLFIPRVNDILLDMYSGEDKLEYKSFQEWRRIGKTVMKGEKSWVVWSKPRKVEKEIGQDQIEEYSMFGLCFLFSSAQVK